MNNVISVCVVTFFLCNTLFATWALIPLDKLVADTELIVTGTLHSATENSEGLGKGYIVVDQILTTGVITFDGVALNQGDNLKITWADNWACAAGMHLARENEKGIWLLEIRKDGSVTAGYPGRFRPLDDLRAVANLAGQKQFKRSDRVEVLPEIKASGKSVDVSPFSDHYPYNALLTAMVSFGLYWVLYKGRYRIR